MKKKQRSNGICKRCKKPKMVDKLNVCQKCHQESSISYWRGKLWQETKKFIKDRDGDRCVTCGAVSEGQNKHAGHFLTGASCSPTLYFHLKNIHVQCYQCNINLSGNWPEYYKFMETRYGSEFVKELRLQRDILKGERWDIPRYKEEIEKLKV